MNVQTSSEEIISNNIPSVTNNIEKTKNMKNEIYKIVKRTIDILAIIIGIIILWPITILIWIANNLVKDNGSVILQERIGKNGEFFKLYKYRTMVVDAEHKLTKYLTKNEQAREEYNKYKKLKISKFLYGRLGKYL